MPAAILACYRYAPRIHPPRLERRPEAAGNRNMTVKACPALDQLFQHCKTCTMFEYAELPETISTEVLAYIQE